MRKNVTIKDRTRAIKEGVRFAIREHALLGHDICISRDGKVVWLTPDEVLAKVGRTEEEFERMKAQEHHD